MPFLINPVQDDRCVFVSYTGEMPSVELSAARREANGVLGHQHWNRILIDVTQLQSIPTPAQLFGWALIFDTQALERGCPCGTAQRFTRSGHFGFAP